MTYRSVVIGSMDTRKSKEMLAHERLVERLAKGKVTNVTTGNGVIRFKYDGLIQTYNLKIYQEYHTKSIYKKILIQAKEFSYTQKAFLNQRNNSIYPH